MKHVAELSRAFRPLVEKRFSFLESEFGFQTDAASKATYVVYISPTLNVLICLDPYLSGQIELGFRRSKQHSPSYGISELLAITDPKNGAEFLDPALNTVTELDEGLNRLAELLKTQFRSLLNGELAILERLDEKRATLWSR